VILEKEFYERAIRSLPIACVDLVVYHGDKILMLKRTNEPLAGHWWFPGGRVWLGESRIAAAVRKLSQECGLYAKAADFQRKSTFDIILTRTDGSISHSVSTLFWIDVGLGGEAPPSVVLDDQSSAHRWLTAREWLALEENGGIHPWLQQRLHETL
jgi:ADP-ribose pyrophosphatase YjhB (NUDIX family)